MKDQLDEKLPSSLKLGPAQLVCKAETHAKQPLPLSQAHTKDDTQHTIIESMESEGLFSLLKRALIELFKGPGRETTSASVCMCASDRVLVKVHKCVCDSILHLCLTVVNCMAAIS